MDDPWQRPPDVEEVHDAAFRQISRQLELLRAAPGRQSCGILVLGEAGSGKTHLLTRVSRKLSRVNHLMFVRRIAHPDEVATCVWRSMIDSLLRPLPEGSGIARNPLEDLMVHVFARAIETDLDRGIREGDARVRERIARIREDPAHLAVTLRRGRHRAAIWKHLAREVSTRHPEAGMDLVRGLYTHCCLVQDPDRQELRSWLQGQPVDEEVLHRLGLPPWIDEDREPASDPRRLREERALDAIQTIALLSSYYQPMILVFDQLEGLRPYSEDLARLSEDDEALRLLHRFTDTVREIFTRCPNLLILTCMFPSLWNQVFQDRPGFQSYNDRVAQRDVALDSLEPASARALLDLRLAPVREIWDPGNPLLPFEERDLPGVLQASKRRGGSIRAFLTCCNDVWEDWVVTGVTPKLLDPRLGRESLFRAAPALDRSASNYEERTFGALGHRLHELLAGARDETARDVPDEDRLFGRLRALSLLIARYRGGCLLSPLALGRRIMPLNFGVGSHASGGGTFVVVTSAQGSRWTSRLKNLLESLAGSPSPARVLLVRDGRVALPAAGVGAHAFLELLDRGAGYLALAADQIALLEAHYALLGQVENRDLEIAGEVLSVVDLLAFWHHRRSLTDHPFFRMLELAGSLAETPSATALGAAAPPG